MTDFLLGFLGGIATGIALIGVACVILLEKEIKKWDKENWK